MEFVYLDRNDCIRNNEDYSQRRVYFHRSRLFVNGAKLSSNASLDHELVPGDKVKVDCIPNLIGGAGDQDEDVLNSLKEDGFNFYVQNESHWIALAVHVKTTDRGIKITKSLKKAVKIYNSKNWGMGNSNSNIIATTKSNIFLYCCCRIIMRRISTRRIFQLDELCIFIRLKLLLMAQGKSGFAVIESGKYAGQRVEFEREQCIAFGLSLKSADLTLLFQYGKEIDKSIIQPLLPMYRILIYFLGDHVHIQVKPYNSYCVDKLWIGDKEPMKDVPTQEEQLNFKKYLYDHGLDAGGFDSLARGQRIIRPFIPLKGGQTPLKRQN